MKKLENNIFFKNTELKKNINKISNVFNKYGVVVIDNFFKSILLKKKPNINHYPK